MRTFIVFIFAFVAAGAFAAEHPRLLFSKEDIAGLKARAQHPVLKPLAQRVFERAEKQQAFSPIIVSRTKRGEPDTPGESKGIASARALQGRVITYCMAFTLSGEKKYCDLAVKELNHALSDWKIWVDTAHPPPYDLMTGEVCFTFGLAYDWLYNDLSPEERTRLREGCEKRGLAAYEAGVAKKMNWAAGHNNWNAVCNGGAVMAALAFEGESEYSQRVIENAAANMKSFWNHLADDGGWDEGTGYWAYGNRYGVLAAEALRRCGKPGGAEVFKRAGVKQTCYFPVVFNPGSKLSASFGDVTVRANDAIFYLLGREYKNPHFIAFEDRAEPPAKPDGWPQDALRLLWRPIDENWLPEAKPADAPKIDPVYAFPSIGWGMMAPALPDPPYFLAFKSGSLAASHTHLDLNAICLAWRDTFLIQELGSRPYPADYFSGKRSSYYEITTQGQNSVVIGDKGQLPGKAGKLLGPLSGPNFSAFTGIADGAYEINAIRARRTAVFVNQRYWVLLDDVATAKSESIELRFHTYGNIKENGAGWLIENDGAALDVFSSSTVKGRVETPDGWIRPVSVLSLRSKKDAATHAVATVLYPRGKDDPRAGEVKFSDDGSKLNVSIGKDEVHFEFQQNAWAVTSVSVQK
jgi:hypothetical protein